MTSRENDLYLSSKFERRETAYNLRDSKNKVNVPLPCTNCIKIALAIAIRQGIHGKQLFYY